MIGDTGSGGPTIFLVAGEPSGDALGARLMSALKEARGDAVRFAGIGGAGMAAEGLDSLFPMSELSLMGLAEVLPHVPRLLRRIDETVSAIRAQRPDAVVTIDSPGFSFRVARRLAGSGIPLIHYVAPSVWAWRPGRARKIAGFLDHLLALLPFEPPYFQAEGLACTFVGHPVLESGAGDGDGPAFRRRHGIGDDVPLLCLLPGSRQGEVSRLLPVFAETVALVAKSRLDVEVVLPSVEGLAAAVSSATAMWPVRVRVVTGDAEKFDAFAAADVALAASGTVALELAMAKTPAVIAYRMHPLTGWLARRLVRVRYVSLVNLMLDRPVMPELLLGECRADRLAKAVTSLLDDPQARAAQASGAAEALAVLGLDGAAPSRRAADVVLDVIASVKPKSGSPAA